MDWDFILQSSIIYHAFSNLKSNGEWSTNHLMFEEWLNDQEQFEEC